MIWAVAAVVFFGTALLALGEAIKPFQAFQMEGESFPSEKVAVGVSALLLAAIFGVKAATELF